MKCLWGSLVRIAIQKILEKKRNDPGNGVLDSDRWSIVHETFAGWPWTLLRLSSLLSSPEQFVYKSPTPKENRTSKKLNSTTSAGSGNALGLCISKKRLIYTKK